MCWACGETTEAYAIPARGYVTLWPFRRLGTDIARALAKTQAHREPHVPRWAVVMDDGRRYRLTANTLEQAREAALAKVQGDPGVLARFVAASPHGDVYALTETLVHLDMVTAAGHPDAELIGINGIAVAKEGTPFSAIDLRLLTKKLSSQLVEVERQRMRPVIRRYLERLDDVDWTRGPAVDRALRNAREFLARTAPGAVLPSWSQRVKISVQDVVSKTKIALNETYLPSLSTSLAQPDLTSVNRIATQNGWFLRDEWGRRSDDLTARGREIVRDGLRQGLGRNEIGQRLRTALPNLATKYGQRYAATAASVAVSRARSYTEVSSYASVGIEYLSVQAVLDERTTEICFVSGTLIDTPYGERPIEEIAKGDIVYTGQRLHRPVNRLFQHEADGVFRLKLSNGRRILVTGNHPIMTPSGWIRAGDLRKGDLVATKRTSQGVRLDGENVRALRGGVQDKNLLPKTRADALLLGPVSPCCAEGRQGGRRSGENLRAMRGDLSPAASGRQERQGAALLLEGVQVEQGRRGPGEDGHADLRQVRQGVPAGGVEADPQAPVMLIGVSQGGPDRGHVRNVRACRPCAAGTGEKIGDGDVLLLGGVPGKQEGDDLPGVRQADRCFECKARTARRTNLLLRRMLSKEFADDRVGNDGRRGHEQSGNDLSARGADQKSLDRFRDPPREGGDRGRRDVLARDASGKGPEHRGAGAAQGAGDQGCRVHAYPIFGAGASFVRRHVPRPGGKGEAHRGAYLRGSQSVGIVAVDYIPGRVTVYNLSVEDDPTYIAEGVIVHNCRALDGTVIEVQAAQAQIDQAASVARPEDIYTQSPFMRVTRDQQTGDRNIVTQTGTRIARVVQSGVGRRDDRGRHEFYRAGQRLNEANIGPPPYHHLCRSWTIPRSDVVQVPAGYAARTVAPAIHAFDGRLGRSVPTGRDSMTRQPVEQFRAPRAGGPPVVAGSHLPIDDYQLPVFRENLPMAQRMSSADGDAIAFRASPHDYRSQGFKPDAWKFTTPSTAHDLDGLFGPPGSDAVAELFIKGNRNRAIASALANPSAVGRDSLWRIADVQGRNVEWVRARMLNTPGYSRAADNYRRAVAEGRSLKEITIAAEALIDTGTARGWLARSARLDAVTEAQTARVRAVSRGTPTTAKPKQRPKPQPKERQPDTVEQPTPTETRRPLAPADQPLDELPVVSSIYAARPDPQAMVAAVWDQGTTALASAFKVEAGVGRLAAQRPWARVTRPGFVGNKSRPLFDAAEIELAASDKVASVFMTTETVGDLAWQEVVENIVRSEAARGYRGVRDWIVTDRRGVTRFIRIDGATVAAIQEAGALEGRIAGIYSGGQEAFSGVGAYVVDDLRAFYPRADIDWNNRNLIPGVSVQEQVERRIAAVRAELTERIQARAASKGSPLSPQEVGSEIRAAVRETAGRGSVASKMRASSEQRGFAEHGDAYGNAYARAKLQSRNNLKEAGKTATLVPADEITELLDRALGYSSDGLRAALQTVPMPDLIVTGRSSSVTRAWCSPRGMLKDTSLIKLHSTVTKVKKLPLPETMPTITPGSAKWNKAVERKKWEEVFAHEVQHHVDTVGVNDLAAQAARDLAITDGRVKNIYGHTNPRFVEVGLPGRFVDHYDGKVYGGARDALVDDAIANVARSADELRAVTAEHRSDTGFGLSSSEYSTMARQRLENDRETARMWEKDPGQAAFIISVMRGHYTPY